MRKRNALILLILGLPAFAFAEREGVILQDHTVAHAHPFQPNSKPYRVFNTGDVVHIDDVKVQQSSAGAADVDWYQTSSMDSAGWLDGKQLFVFNDDQLFSSFIEGTVPVSVGSEEADDVVAKGKIINSEEFYAREAKNVNPKVRRHAAQRAVFYAASNDQVVAFTQGFEKDKDDLVRTHAYEALLGLNTLADVLANPEIEKLLKTAVEKASGAELDDLIQLISRSGYADKPRIEIQAARKKSPTAISSLSTIRTQESNDVLIRLINDPDDIIRNRAIDALVMEVNLDKDESGQPRHDADHEAIIRTAYRNASKASRIVLTANFCAERYGWVWVIEEAANDPSPEPFSLLINSLDRRIASTKARDDSEKDRAATARLQEKINAVTNLDRKKILEGYVLKFKSLGR